jgi:hypothetical protein
MTLTGSAGERPIRDENGLFVERAAGTRCAFVCAMLDATARSLAPLLVLVALCAITPACASAASDDGSVGVDDYKSKKGKLQLVVTVDWEGRDLRDDNLRAMEDLRTKFPQVKIVHFLNAAYFVKRGAVAADVATQMQRALRPGDEKGLHIHGWKRLFEASGVTFRASPTFWGTSLDVHGQECSDDCGHEVPISLYTAGELRKVVKLSLDTLEANGFGRAKSFRTGGWIAKPSVREAIAAEGIRYEHSAVPTVFLEQKLGTVPLYGWLSELWQGTTNVSQPYAISTATASLTEVPDNGALADYVSAQQMIDTFEANKAAFLQDRKKSVVVSIGFHQETAATYLPQLEAALTRIYAETKAENIAFENVTSEALTAGAAVVSP